ncbi:dihydroxyacetone kinase subunit DhaL [Vibrio nigripulchritudo]|uniref:dihydroxyacetone kinase subunit DhaL n=1 Tax=Vibrio nigripulchritudo TaxID=28173 RepID=UPI0024904F6E|nr:dihydroxyacetone kinase subunit DhaL [Vibrio nigripulchritudo]BDU37948.1 dihydroxyacetone kinase subunit L [Vibrio nigripulchritudo]BDU43670.1 dihydroxyacetone kinase subunit L [Vibrio nigripulchritudo]
MNREDEFKEQAIKIFKHREQALAAICQSLFENEHILTELDTKIGDGDHGINMSRGAHAIELEMSGWHHLEDRQFLLTLAQSVLKNVGGASGALYGTLLIEWSRSFAPECFHADEFRRGVLAVQKRGKSNLGDKTMLDVLIPFSTLWQQTKNKPLDKATLSHFKSELSQYCQKTKELRAQIGRAAYLGSRSIGHVDPGAYSSMLMINAALDVLMENMYEPQSC